MWRLALLRATFLSVVAAAAGVLGAAGVFGGAGVFGAAFLRPEVLGGSLFSSLTTTMSALSATGGASDASDKARVVERVTRSIVSVDGIEDESGMVEEVVDGVVDDSSCGSC